MRPSGFKRNLIAPVTDVWLLSPPASSVVEVTEVFCVAPVASSAFQAVTKVALDASMAATVSSLQRSVFRPYSRLSSATSLGVRLRPTRTPKPAACGRRTGGRFSASSSEVSREGTLKPEFT
jgi:hypothetical protein